MVVTYILIHTYMNIYIYIKYREIDVFTVSSDRKVARQKGTKCCCCQEDGRRAELVKKMSQMWDTRHAM